MAAGVLVGLGVVSWPARARAQGADIFILDPGSSRVRVELSRAGLLGFLGHDHLIDAPLAGGRVEAALSRLEQSRVVLWFQASSLSVVPGSEPADDIPPVERRMRGPDVLDVQRHSTIAFASTSISGRPNGGGTYQLSIRGVLELLGRQHDIDLPVTARIEGDTLTATGKVGLSLRNLGVTPPSVGGVVKVDDRFTVTFSVQGRSAPASATRDGGRP